MERGPRPAGAPVSWTLTIRDANPAELKLVRHELQGDG
jgi:hypothetical protein